MTIPGQDGSHRRSATRAPVDRPIKLQFDDSMDVIEGMCRNVSIGGMFINFDQARPAGSLVRFELALDDNQAIRGLGEVVWMKSKSDFSAANAGFGLKFRFLEQQDRQLIFKLVSQHIKERLSRRDPLTGDPATLEAESSPSVFEDATVVSAPPADVAIPPAPEPPMQEAPAVAAYTPPEGGFDLPPLAPSDPEPEPTLPESTLPESLVPEPSVPESSVPESSLPEPSVTEHLLPPTEAPRPTFFGSAPEPAEPVPGAGSEHEPVDRLPIDLDPSVGDTPLYELGLDPEPSTGLFAEPAAASTPGLDTATTASDSQESAADWESAVDMREPVLSDAGAAQRREFPLLPALAVLLLTAAAGFFLYKDQILGRFFGGPEVVSSEEQGSAAAGSSRDPQSAGGGEATTATPPAGAGGEATTTAASPPPAAAPPPPVTAPPPPAPVTPPPSRQAPPATATARAFTRLEDISWSAIPGGLKVVLTADGEIPTGRYKYFHLDGDSPREVIKLIGVRQGFGKNSLAVGGPGVERIRTGLHRVSGQNELHVVIDLLGPRWQITDVRSVGSRLEFQISEP